MAQTIGPKRKIYRGDAGQNDPQQKELLCSVAGFKPGQLVVAASGEFALPPSASTSAFYVLNAPMHQDPLTYTYALDETGFGYVPRSRDVYLVQAVAGTYADGAPLTHDGTGKVRAVNAAAATPERIIGHVWTPYGESVTATAGQLIDVRIP